MGVAYGSDAEKINKTTLAEPNRWAGLSAQSGLPEGN